MHSHIRGARRIRRHIFYRQLPHGPQEVHVCQRTPSKIQSNRGDQLVAAPKQIEKWNFEGVQRRAGKKDIEWHLVHTWGQHVHGEADRMTGILKKQLQRSLEGKKYTHEETSSMLLQEAAQIFNSRPTAGGMWAEGDALSQRILCWEEPRQGSPWPNHDPACNLTRNFA
jgi:hypothetical protein